MSASAPEASFPQIAAIHVALAAPGPLGRGLASMQQWPRRSNPSVPTQPAVLMAARGTRHATKRAGVGRVMVHRTLFGGWADA